MTPAQQAAIASADAKMEPAMRLYKLRNRISYHVGMLSLRDLERLVALVDGLTHEEAQMVARYAEGLAEWRQPEPQCGDASDQAGTDTPNPAR